MTIVSYKSGQFAVQNKSKFKFTILKYPLNFSIRILGKMKILYLLDFQPNPLPKLVFNFLNYLRFYFTEKRSYHSSYKSINY